MNVIIAVFQQLALLVALFFWALAAGYLAQTAAAFWSTYSREGTISSISTEVVLYRAFKLALFVWLGLFLLAVHDLLPVVLS